MMSDKSSAYVALGISVDEAMGDDSVIECVRRENEIKFFTSITGFEKGIRVAKRNENVRIKFNLLNA